MIGFNIDSNFSESVKHDLADVLKYLKLYLNYNCAIQKGLELNKNKIKLYNNLKVQFENVLGDRRLKDIGDSYCRSIMNSLRTIDNKYLPVSSKVSHDAS